MRFFDSRFGVDFAWYRTNATNQLIRLGMDPASGYDAKMINAGNIQNEGIEFMVTADIIRSEGLKWNAQLNLSHNENRIIKALRRRWYRVSCDGVQPRYVRQPEDPRSRRR